MDTIIISYILLLLIVLIEECRIFQLKDDLRREKQYRERDNKLSELSRKLAVDMAIVDERTDVLSEQYRKTCEDFQETCKDFSESMKVK